MNAASQDSRRETRRDVIRHSIGLWGPLGLVTVIAFAIALRFVGAPPPDRVTIATGPADGGYAAAGALFAAALEDAGIGVDLVATKGALENLELLRSGAVDIGLVQGGLADDEEPELAGIASLYLEPLWLFARRPVTHLTELRGESVELGPEGSGTRVLAKRLFDVAGVEIIERGGDADAARVALQSGDAAAVVHMAAPRSEQILALLRSEPTLVPASFDRAEGVARALTYLRHVRVYAGSVDLAQGLPAEDLETVAAAAMLVGRDDLHPAVVGLLIGSARVHFSDRGVLEDAGEFPTLALLDIPPSAAARTAVEQGPSFLYRVFPFQVAALIDRLKILLLPLLTLLFPLFRLAPPLYRWRTRRRILRWYRQMLDLERSLREGDGSLERREAAARELDRFGEQVATIKVPLSYADELYHLRMHLRMVRDELGL